jgi:dTDP-4-dehydrorhamnose reductase
MRVLVIGAGGTLGHALMSIHTATSTRHDLVGCGRPGSGLEVEFDVTEEAAVRSVFSDIRPALVMHTAAATQVDRCEREPEWAHTCNVEGSRNVANACREVGAAAMYISTNFVFDGQKDGPYEPSDPPNPLSVYGKTKLEGEKLFTDVLEQLWIVRTSWLFGEGGKSVFSAAIDKARKREAIRMVCDQKGRPTYAPDLARTLIELIDKAPPGIYHVANKGVATPAQMARFALDRADFGDVKIQEVTTEEWNAPATRPKNGVLACDDPIGGSLRHWHGAVAEVFPAANLGA